MVGASLLLTVVLLGRLAGVVGVLRRLENWRAYKPTVAGGVTEPGREHPRPEKPAGDPWGLAERGRQGREFRWFSDELATRISDGGEAVESGD
jgi:hypothetical protein